MTISKEDKAFLDEKIEEIESYCKRKQIPAAFIYTAENTSEKTVYVNKVVTPMRCSVTLKKDCISPLLVINHGFSIVPNSVADYNFDNFSSDDDEIENNEE